MLAAHLLHDLEVYWALKIIGNMAEWSKAPESGFGGFIPPIYLVRKGEGSNPSVVKPFASPDKVGLRS